MMNLFFSINKVPDQKWYAASIAELSQRFPEDAPGFFGPGSITWKIYREPGILLGSYRALLLQVAHPAVGAGVQIYSNFQKDYLGRAYRTFLNMASLFFGSCTLAKKTAAHLHHMHYRITGTYRAADGTEHAFCANEPALLTWILATLVDTSLVAYELLCPPLTMIEKEQFIQEAQITAQLMGIPKGYFPQNYQDFYKYYYHTIDGSELSINSTAESLAVDILRGPFPFIRKWNTLFATALLPSRLIKDYQLVWNSKNQRRFRFLLSFMRRLYRLCPTALRYAPPYYQASYRIAAAKKEKTKALPAFFHWLGKHFTTPFLIREY